VLLGAMALSGCLLPIPHPRLHEFGVVGRIVASESKLPIKGAEVHPVDDPAKETVTNAGGVFRVKPVYAWHEAYFIGPICLSLLPGFDVPGFTRVTLITANGYQGITHSAEQLTQSGEYIGSSTFVMGTQP
jgi:hypothetical protein